MENSVVVVAAASPNSTRYSYKAVKLLSEHGFNVAPLGFAKGEAAGVDILSLPSKPQIENVHTISLYMRPENQKEWYDYFFSLSPERIIFNPGTENRELSEMARDRGIAVVYDCTLMMLGRGGF